MSKSKISIILALDGEQKFTAGMKSAQASVKLCDNELKALQQECKGSANTIDALTKKNELLSRSQEAYVRTLDAAKAGEKNARENYKKATSELEDLKKKLEFVEKQYKETGRATDEAGHSAEDYREAIERQQTKIYNAETALSKWETAVSRATADVKKANSAVDENSRYLNEAKSSADGCATSIDAFGKAVQEAGKDAEESAGKVSGISDIFSGVQSGFIGGVGFRLAESFMKLGDMAAEAAKKLIEAGKAAAAYADDVLTTAEITGMTTDRIQEITYAANLMDTSLDTVESSMRKNLASMRSAAKGSSEYAKAYANLGVSVRNTDGTLRDSEDVYWDCIDALGKIEDRTERDAAAMQIFGKSAQELNPLIGKGSKGFAELAKEAHDVGYVLGTETLGKLGAVQDSFDRLDVAGEAFGNTLGAFVAPVLGGLADITADALSGVTSFLRGSRTETEETLSAIVSSVKEAEEIVEAAGSWETGIAKELGELAYYKDTLYDVIEAGKADEDQKIRVSQIVDELGDKVPALTAAWDEQNGVLRLSKEQVDALIDSQEEYIRQTAIAKAREEAWAAVAEAEIKAKEAEVIFNQKLAEAGKLLGKSVESLDDLNEELDYMAINPMMAGTDTHTQLQTVAREAGAAKKSFDDLSPSVDNLREKVKLIDDVADAMGTDTYLAGKKAEEGMKIAETATEEAMNSARESVGQFGDAAQDMAEVVFDAFNEAHDAAESAFSVDAFEAWEKNAENGIGKMQESFEKQAQILGEYSENFAIVSEDLRERSPEFLSYIQNLGKEGAQLVAELADAFRKGDTKAVEDLISKYETTLDAQDEIADISARNTLELKKGLGELGSAQKEWTALDTALDKVKSSGLPDALAEELEKVVKIAKEEGVKIPEGLAEEIESSEDPENAAATCIGKLVNAIYGQREALYNISKDTGLQIKAGLIKGLEDYGPVVSAATGMIDAAWQAQRKRAQIESPAKLFRDKVGLFIPAGVADGIRNGSTLTEQAAEESMNKTLAVMKKWLTRNKAGVGEIAYTWQAVATAALRNGFGISKTKTEGVGDDAKTVQKTRSEYAGEILRAATSYMSNLKELYDVSTRQEISYWKSVRKRLDSGTQAWITASGKIRKLQKQASEEAKAQRSAEKQDIQQYYAGLLASSEEYVSYRKATGSVSAEQERRYWEKQISIYRKGSDEYKAIQVKLVALDAQIVADRLATYESYISHRAALHGVSIQNEKAYWQEHLAEFKKGSSEFKSVQERIASLESSIGTSEVAASVLAVYQTYFETSEKAVEQYWANIRKVYKAGTEERLEADRAYVAAKEALRDRMISIEEEYQDKIDQANARYKDAVQARREAIYSAFGLFDEFQSTSSSGEQLLFNIQSQAAGYEEWIKALDELRGRGVFSEELLKELQEKGPTDIAAIKALLTLTDDQMRLYQEAYDQKLKFSDKEAKKENKELKAEVKAEIKDLKAEMKTALAAANEPITDELKAVATKIQTVAEDQTAALVAAFTGTGAKVSGSTGNSVSKSTKTAAGVTVEQTNGLTKKQTEKKADALRAIRSAKKLKNPLTAEERKQHAAIYNYLADRYGVAGSAALYTKLAEIFDLPEYKGTGSERMAILAALKEHGLRSGTWRAEGGLRWMDEDLETVGPEIIVRKSDKAILTRLEAADTVIPANLAKNLFAWGAINPQDIGAVSTAALNERLAQAYDVQAGAMSGSAAVARDILSLLGEYLPHIADGHEIRLDTGVLVGAMAGGMSRELARRSRRTIR